MRTSVQTLIVAACLHFAGTLATAQTPPALTPNVLESFDALSLEDLLNVKISVATKQETATREAPAVVSVVSRQEIANSGARDLIDVLRLVPGFEFGLDVEGLVGAGFRGNWGFEGKILLLIDGMEHNETLFNAVAFGNHYSVDEIERIEIIRGPGSVIYGGYAELAVINIITRSAGELNGGAISGTYGLTRESFNRRNLSAIYGRKTGELGVKVSAFGGQGRRSNRIYYDIYGGQYDMTDDSQLDPLNFKTAVDYKRFKLQLEYDDYRMSGRDAFDAVLDGTHHVRFTSFFSALTYESKPDKPLVFQARAGFKHQKPWNTTDEVSKDAATYYDGRANRFSQIATLSYQATSQLSLLIGEELTLDQARIHDRSTPEYYAVPMLDREFTNVAALSQVSYKYENLNFSGGLRYDYHSQYGKSIVPRLSLTAIQNRLHAKLLFSQAFRAPSIENINYNSEIKAEKTTVYEAEAGLQINQNGFIAVNIFNIAISKPIIYYYDEATEVDLYINAERSGTRGLEVDGRLKFKQWYANLTYSYYERNGATSDLYKIAGNDRVHTAFPAHKATLSGHYQLTDAVSINPSLIYFGPRYGYDTVDADGYSVVSRFNEKFLANVYISCQNIPCKNVTFGLGLFDAGESHYDFFQAYDGYHAPFPGPTRELVLKISYRFDAQ